MAVVRQNSVFIDPENCGSSVGYHIVISNYERTKDNKTAVTYNLSGTVTLADCNHKIDWDFGNSSDNPVEKIDAAIDMLMEFRKNYIVMQKQYAQLSKEK
jgi:hypothetical protein